MEKDANGVDIYIKDQMQSQTGSQVNVNLVDEMLQKGQIWETLFGEKEWLQF